MHHNDCNVNVYLKRQVVNHVRLTSLIVSKHTSVLVVRLSTLLSLLELFPAHCFLLNTSYCTLLSLLELFPAHGKSPVDQTSVARKLWA